jgi:glycosyltransferase involved in cell wall biosynthesis
MRPLSILHLLSNRWWTGTAEPVLATAQGLLERRQQVVLGVPAGSPVEELARKAGVPLLEGLRLDPRFHPSSWLQDVRTLSAFLRRTPVDVLHTHLSHDHWLALSAVRLLNPSRGRVPLQVRTVHTPRPPRSLSNRWLLQHGAAHLITVSSTLQRNLAARLRISSARISVIAGAVNSQRFHPALSGAHIRRELGLSATTPLVGIVARLAPSRGHLTLVEAFAQVHTAIPAARLLIVGKGEFRPHIERQIREFGLAEAVIFGGYREDDLPEVLAAMDIFVLLAPGSEGSCRAVLEAMATGKAVVAPRVGALQDIVLDGETGLLIAPQSHSALAHAISRLLRAPEQARQMGLRGRQRIEHDFSRPRQIEQVLQLYHQLEATQRRASTRRNG